jgi:hypothetical protein
MRGGARLEALTALADRATASSGQWLNSDSAWNPFDQPPDALHSVD